MKLKFIGAIDEVTGSMTLLETTSGKILIDCGLHQGLDFIVKKNLEPLPFEVRDISAVILTHAHLDHSGLIPHLVKLGFRGNIYATKPTLKLAKIIMADSAHIFEKSENHLLKSFYDIEDVIVATSLFKPQTFHVPFSALGMTITLLPAGHILGAASVQIQADQTIIFSGDLGRIEDPLIPAPEKCPKADIVVMESTYGGRIREGNLEIELTQFLKKIKTQSCIGIIASFAVARSQMLITLINQYYKLNPNDKIRLVIDGPMMIEANKVYKEFSQETKLPEILLESLENVEVIDHTREWESIKKQTGPLIVISSSGMVSGGRILRYLENWQNDTKACLFLPGYQAEGTAGKQLSEGNRTIHICDGKEITWSGEVISSQAFSSHADQNGLIDWLSNIDKSTAIYLNHGEKTSKECLVSKLHELGYQNVLIAGSK